MRDHEIPDAEGAAAHGDGVPLPGLQVFAARNDGIARGEMPRQRIVEGAGGIDRFMQMAAEGSQVADVVEMVVGYQHGAEIIEA